MLQIFNKKLKFFFFRLRWPIRRRPKSKPNTTVVIKKFRKSNSKTHHKLQQHTNGSVSSAVIHPATPNTVKGGEFNASKLVRLATFNAALFSMAPAVPKNVKSSSSDFENGGGRNTSHSRTNSLSNHPKSILKQSPLHPNSMSCNSLDGNLVSRQQNFAKSKLRVSINLPDKEISLKKSGQLSFIDQGKDGFSGVHVNNDGRVQKGKGQLRIPTSTKRRRIERQNSRQNHNRSTRETIAPPLVCRAISPDVFTID